MSYSTIQTMREQSFNPFITISQSEFSDSKALNEKLSNAARLGFFYLEMPENCKKLIHHAVQYGNTFYNNHNTKNEKLEGFSGYHDREESQIESLYLEKKYWNEKLSPELIDLAKLMNELAIEILKKTLTICNIPQNQWDKATGQSSNNNGLTHFTFNHYRPEKEKEGLGAHRDFGQITVLFINEFGLQAKINNEWIDVAPLKDHFVINFGRALETTINNPEQLTAAWHRVVRVAKDRISLGVFVDNKVDSPLYQRDGNGNYTVVEPSYDAYIKKCFAESYG